MPRRCDVKHSSVAPTRVRASANSLFIINSAAMFSYHPCPWIPTRDKEVKGYSELPNDVMMSGCLNVQTNPMH
jgi:hypothetical protein